MMPAELAERLERDGYVLFPGYLEARQFGSCGLLQTLKATFYPPLASIANHWSDSHRYPERLADFHAQCRAAGQQQDLSRFTRLRATEHLPLRQCVTAFPLQLCGLLSRPGEDFSGGELLLTEQRPRQQSRPIVVPLRLGDIAIIPGGRRPVSGRQGHYPVSTRHAISRVRSGERLGLEVFFQLS